VDECDSILIDEARTPLIISGPAEASTDKYIIINKIIPKLKEQDHFTTEEKSKSISLTDEGNKKVEELLGLDNLYDAHNIEILHHVMQALKAHYMYRKDVEYMIQNDEIVIVDEFTGRLMPGRRWSDGLQGVERKSILDVTKVDELVDLPVRITRDIDESRLAGRLFIQTMDRANREQVLDRPVVRHRLEYGEVTEILVGEVLVQRLDFVRNVFQSGRVLVDHFTDLPKQVFDFRFVFERKETELEHRERFFLT
jgi:hypothetical protein